MWIYPSKFAWGLHTRYCTDDRYEHDGKTEAGSAWTFYDDCSDVGFPDWWQGTQQNHESVTVILFSILRGDIPFSVAGSDWLPVLWLGLINTGLGCFFYFSSIGKLPAQTVAVCGYIEPLSAVLLSTIVLNERMQPLRFLGAALIIGGALYGEIAVRK